MFKKIAFGQVRHLLTALGGGLVNAGYITSSELNILVGAGMIIVGLAWSAIAPEKKEPKYNEE